MADVSTSSVHFKGPDAARGKCLNLVEVLRADIFWVVSRMEMRDER